MIEDFDIWNNLKKDIESKEPVKKFPKEREVWMCTLGKNIGYEQNGIGSEFLRPILIIKKFNNKMFWVIPLSSKQKRFDFYFNFEDKDKNLVSLVLAQMKLVSIKRIGRKLYDMESKTFNEVRCKIKSFL